MPRHPQGRPPHPGRHHLLPHLPSSAPSWQVGGPSQPAPWGPLKHATPCQLQTLPSPPGPGPPTGLRCIWPMGGHRCRGMKTRCVQPPGSPAEARTRVARVQRGRAHRVSLPCSPEALTDSSGKLQIDLSIREMVPKARVCSCTFSDSTNQGKMIWKGNKETPSHLLWERPPTPKSSVHSPTTSETNRGFLPRHRCQKDSER